VSYHSIFIILHCSIILHPHLSASSFFYIFIFLHPHFSTSSFFYILIFLHPHFSASSSFYILIFLHPHFSASSFFCILIFLHCSIFLHQEIFNQKSEPPKLKMKMDCKACEELKPQQPDGCEDFDDEA